MSFSARVESPLSVGSCVQVVLPRVQDSAGVEMAASSSLELCIRYEYPQSRLALSDYWGSFLTAVWPPDSRFPVHPLAVLCWGPFSSGLQERAKTDVLEVAACNGAAEKRPGHQRLSPVQCCALWRRQGQHAELDYIVCAPDARRSGLAGVAFQASAAALWGLGVETVSLEVSAQNAVAMCFYTRLGFRTVRVRKAYYQKNGSAEDAVVMMKDLHFT